MSALTHAQRLSLLCFVSFVGHTLLAYSIWTNLGSLGQSPTWEVMGKYTPDFLWPMLFLILGLTAFVGMFNHDVARLSFWYGAVLMEWWAIAGAVVWVQTGTPQPGAIFLFYIGMLKAMIAELLFRENVTAMAVQKITNDAKDIAHEVGS